MGFFKKTFKEKTIAKIWSSFYEKENLIEDFKGGEGKADAIIVTTTGIYLFLIYSIKGNVEYSKEEKLWREIHSDGGTSSFLNPFIDLSNLKKHILVSLKDEDLPIFLVPIFPNVEKTTTDFFNIKSFRAMIDSQSKVFSNEEVNKYSEEIKKIGTYKTN